jgi:2-keto-4-pentenoate hydratase
MRISKVETAADEIVRARLSRTPLEPLHPTLRPIDEGAAYLVQEAVHRRLEPMLGPRIGYKIACTTPVMQAYLGIGSPCAAGIFRDGLHRSGVVLRRGDYRRIGVECEIAVRLADDLAGPVAPAEAASAVGAWIPAVEIVDDRYADWRNTDTPTLIADDFFAAGAVLGEAVADPGDAAALVGSTTINGDEVGRGEGSDVLGHPLNALAWLAASLAQRGRWLRAGEVILLGSLVETKWLDPGDRASIEVAGLGRVDVAVD